MNNKKNFAALSIALIYMLSSDMSFSRVTSDNAGKHSGLYISGQYKPGISSFSDFSVRENNTLKTQQLVALKKDVTSVTFHRNSTRTDATGISKAENFNYPYTVKFQDNAVSFSGAVGYSSSKDIRFEIEGSYEKFDVRNPGGYTITDGYRYFALAREMNADVSKTEPKSDSKAHYTVMRNDGLSIASVMINGCYDFSLNNLEVSPYICIGAGEDFIEFFDAQHIKFAYQGKLGISYSLSSNTTLFADVYYHKVIDNQFKNLSVWYVGELNDNPKTTSALATLNVSYFGGEFGVRFIF